jgi:dihydrofolate reductase
VSPGAGFTAIAAVDDEGGIGRGGGLPWRLKADMEYFRRVTTGPGGDANAVILGRRTWESLPRRFRPLPERRNVVITRDPAATFAGAARAASFDDALAQARARGGEIFVIGGAEVYAAALAHPDCARVLLTRVAGRHGCDVFLPRFAELRPLAEGPEQIEGPLRFRFCVCAPPAPRAGG